MYRSIREEPVVTEALKRAAIVYPRVWDAYEALCWILARRQLSGAIITGASDVYHLHKQAAGGWGVPSITAIYTVSDDLIDIRVIKVG